MYYLLGTYVSICRGVNVGVGVCVGVPPPGEMVQSVSKLVQSV